MNIRKTLLSVAGAAALSLSFAAPMVQADDTQGVTGSAVEEGVFDYSFKFGSMSFTSAEVTTTQTQIVQSARGQIDFEDSHSYNEAGFRLTVSLDDNLTTAEGGYYIAASNVRVWERSSASCKLQATNPPVGGNPYQILTPHLPTGTNDGLLNGVVTTAKGNPLSQEVPVISGSIGRGCGASSVGLYYQMTVPAGTYTGGGTAVYTGDIVLTNTAEVSEPQS